MRIRINSLNVFSNAGYGDVYRFEENGSSNFYNFGVSAGVSLFGVPFKYSYECGNSPGANFIRPQFKLRLDLSQYEKRYVIPDFSLQDSLIRRLASLEAEIRDSQKAINSHNRRYDQLLQRSSEINPMDTILNDPFLGMNYSDSLTFTLERLNHERLKVDSLQTKLFEVRSKMEELRNTTQIKPNKIFKSKKVSPKVLSIGVSTPEEGKFLMQGMTIRGGYVVLKSRKNEHAFAVGTVNSFILNEATGSPFESFQNRINSLTRINTSSADRRILTYKFSRGNPDSTHFYLGGLAGTGKRNILESTGEQARNFVGEFGKGLLIPNIGLVTASVSQSWISNFTGLRNDINDLEDQRSLIGYAFNVKSKGALKPIGIDYTISSTLITPEFSSYGFALQRRDYLRLDISGAKRFKNNSQLKTSYRRDESNLFKSSQIHTKNDIYRVGYTMKIKRHVFINNDFMYLQNLLWGNGFEAKEHWYMNNLNGFVLFPKSKREESINVSMSYSNSSLDQTSYIIEGLYGVRLSKSVQARTRLFHQTQIIMGDSESLESIMQTLDYSYKTWVFGATCGMLLNGAEIDWNASLMISKSEGRVSFSMLAERLIPNAMIPLVNDNPTRLDILPYRLYLQLNYAILN